MIKWARGRLYHGHEGMRSVGHLFMFEDKHFTLKNLVKGDYPPFDCVSLSRADAAGLRDFLNEVLND